MQIELFPEALKVTGDEELTGSGPRGYLSWSQVSSYQTCGEAYRLRYFEHAPSEPSGAAIAGASIHEVIAEAEAAFWWQEGFADQLREVFVRTFVRRVTEAGGELACRWGGRKSRDYPNGEDFRWWLFNGPLMLNRYAQVRAADEDAGSQVLLPNVERKVSAFLRVPQRPEPILLIGYLDQLVLVNADGEAVVRDWKSGRWSEPLQLAVYAWMLANQEAPLTVTRGELVKLRQPLEKTVEAYDLTQWTDLVPRLALDTIRGIEAGVFPIRPSMLCPSCSVREHCPWGSTLEPKT